MSTITGPRPAPRHRYGLPPACRAEWAKLFSIRSTWWTLFVTAVGTLVVTALSASSVAHHGRGWYGALDPTNQSMSGLTIGALAIGVLGALVFTSEYGSGTIRCSMAATPRRARLPDLRIRDTAILACASSLSGASAFKVKWPYTTSMPTPNRPNAQPARQIERGEGMGHHLMEQA